MEFISEWNIFYIVYILSWQRMIVIIRWTNIYYESGIGQEPCYLPWGVKTIQVLPLKGSCTAPEKQRDQIITISHYINLKRAKLNATEVAVPEVRLLSGMACQTQCQWKRQSWRMITVHLSSFSHKPFFFFLQVKNSKSLSRGISEESKSSKRAICISKGRKERRNNCCFSASLKRMLAEKRTRLSCRYRCLYPLPVRMLFPSEEPASPLTAQSPLSSGWPSRFPLSPNECASCHCLFCRSRISKQYHSKTLDFRYAIKSKPCMVVLIQIPAQKEEG